MHFFDASALVKRYVRERESSRVRRLLREREVAVSRLSEAEVISAFARLARDKVMSHAQRDRAASAFVADLSTWHVVEVTAEVMATARRLLMQHSLRSGDALQIASALVLQAAIAQDLEAVVSYDQRMLTASRAEQLTVIGA